MNTVVSDNLFGLDLEAFLHSILSLGLSAWSSRRGRRITGSAPAVLDVLLHCGSLKGRRSGGGKGLASGRGARPVDDGKRFCVLDVACGKR